MQHPIAVSDFFALIQSGKYGTREIHFFYGVVQLHWLNFYSKETKTVVKLAKPRALLGEFYCFAQTITSHLLLQRGL